jgi:xanthine dehydrogenase molybdenum-binding subunit
MQPQGQCVCCLAVIDGTARVTCALSAEKADGREVVTLEGVPADDRELLARAFVSAAGLQCGYCIPAIALRAKVLVDKNPSPSRDEIAKAIDGNLCRCTGYVKVIDAIELYARGGWSTFPTLQRRARGPIARPPSGREHLLGMRLRGRPPRDGCCSVRSCSRLIHVRG